MTRSTQLILLLSFAILGGALAWPSSHGEHVNGWRSLRGGNPEDEIDTVNFTYCLPKCVAVGYCETCGIANASSSLKTVDPPEPPGEWITPNKRIDCGRKYPGACGFSDTFCQKRSEVFLDEYCPKLGVIRFQGQ